MSAVPIGVAQRKSPKDGGAERGTETWISSPRPPGVGSPGGAGVYFSPEKKEAHCTASSRQRECDSRAPC